MIRTLRAAHAAAVEDLRHQPSYALPVPSSRDVVAHLRRRGVEASRTAVITVCALARLPLADV